MEPKENKPANQSKLTVWQNALIKAEGKFMSITNPETTKIEMGFAAQLIQQNDKLQSCSPDSIINAVINVARTGITLNPVMKLAHLVPRNGQCVLDFDYKGLVKILKDNKCLKDLRAVIVYDDEKFAESNNPTVAHVHEIKYAETEEEQKKRKYKGVYCIAFLTDNTTIYTQFTPYWEILKAENVSQSKNSSYSPWKNWREEMIKKTKIRKDFKTLVSGSPSEKVSAAIEIEDKNNGISQEEVKKQQKSNLTAIFDGAEEAQVVGETEKQQPKPQKGEQQSLI